MGENPTAEVELDGQKVVVKKDEYGYVAVKKEPTEKEEFIEYLEQHSQVLDYKDFGDTITVHYQNADDVGYVHNTENVLVLEDYENISVKYLERNSTVEEADVFVQIDVSDAE
jgi:hypothetical protein